jgi:hypothetical protein
VSMFVSMLGSMFGSTFLFQDWMYFGGKGRNSSGIDFIDFCTGG